MVGSSRRKVMGQHPGARKAPWGRSWAIGLLLAALAPDARAEEIGGSRLGVARSEGALDCPDEAHFTRQVATIAGRATEKGLILQVEFIRRPEGLEANLRVSGPRQGRRTLTDPGPSCVALADAAAVTVAILLDPQTTEKAIPSSPPPPATSAPAPPAPATSRPPARLAVGLGPEISGGLTASPALGIGLGSALRPARQGPGVEAGALWLPRRSFVLPDTLGESPGDGEVQVALVAARVAGCWWGGGPRLQGAACAEVGAGAYLASGVHYYKTQDSSGLWVGAGPGLRAAGVLGGPVGWGAGVSWFFPLHRHDFVVDRLGKAFESSATGGWLARVTLEATIW
jgi:hypothetical protein